MSDTRLTLTVSPEIWGVGKTTLLNRAVNKLDGRKVQAIAAVEPDNLPDYPDPFPIWHRKEDAA